MSRSRIQYDANGRPIIQCHTCNLWGHFARECPTTNTPQLLCRWCGPGDHDDSKCPKFGVNLITVGVDEEEVLAITWQQAKEYSDPAEEKKKFAAARAEVGKVSQAVTPSNIAGTSMRNSAEQNIVRQILQTEVQVKVSDLLLTMPQLRFALSNMAGESSLEKEKSSGEPSRRKEKEIVTGGEDQAFEANGLKR